jgi:hypothetical protein
MAKNKKPSESPEKTIDPTESILSFLKAKNKDKEIATMFYGPDSVFTKAIESPGGPEIVKRFSEISNALASAEDPCDDLRWKLLQQLAVLRAGPAPEVPDIVSAFKAVVPATAGSWKPEGEEAPNILVDTAFPTARGDVEWTSAVWQFLDFVYDWKFKQPQGSDHAPVVMIPTNRETTPLLLANAKLGRVFSLVVEGLPGPRGLMYPVWWKLGLLPLGEDNNFVKAIHAGFAAVTKNCNKRIRLRWWLKPHEGSAPGWFDDLDDDNSSVQVAAACAAVALFSDEPSDARPLLDETVAVSACLSGRGLDLSKRDWAENHKIGAVAYYQRKLEGATQAGLSGVVFSSSHSGLEKDTKRRSEGNNPGPIVQCVDNLADAYDGLLITSKAIQAYKREIVYDWKGGVDENGKPLEKDGKVRGKWIEKETPEEFKK